MPSLMITSDEFHNLPVECQQTLMSHFGFQLESSTHAEQPAHSSAGDDEELPEFSFSQAKKAYSSFQPRTQEIIREIVNFPKDGFMLSALEKKLYAKPNGLKGSWAGITKVTRRILEDDEAMLILWTHKGNDGWHGRLSEATHRSFRKVLGM